MSTETNETVVNIAETSESIIKPTAGAAASHEELLTRYENAVKDNAKYREERTAHRKQIQELEDQARKVPELEASIPKIEQQARERVAKADFKARLRAEGIVDPDFLKLVDLSKVEYDADGEPSNADEIWTAFREAKSYLFAGKSAVDTSTSSIHKAPSQKVETFDWLTATAEEVKRADKPSRYKP